MNPENVLGCLLELRDYQRLEELVEHYIHESDWSYVINLLHRSKSLEEIAPNIGFPLREGIMRDGVFALLDLSIFSGVDIDPLQTFKDLRGDSLSDIRRHAREGIIDIVKDQLSHGITFFLDIDSFLDIDFKILIPYILEKRMKEIQALESRPPLSDVYSTYYGYTILTNGGIMTKESGIPDELRGRLTGVLGDIGNVESLIAKQLKFSPLAFRGCSAYLKILLWNMLKFSLGGNKSRAAALQRLGDIGDSKALGIIEPALIDFLERYRTKRTQERGDAGKLADIIRAFVRIDSVRFLDTYKPVSSPLIRFSSAIYRHYETQRKMLENIVTEGLQER